MKFYAACGLFATRFDIYDGVLLIKESQNRAVELVKVARHHKWLYAFLERAVETNDYLVALAGHGMMLYGMLAHHGRLKADEAFLAANGLSEKQILAPVDPDSE